MVDPTPPRRRFQFRLRTLMIGVTVFCLVVGGYIGWQAKIVRERTRLREQFFVRQKNPFEDDETVREPVSDAGVGWIRRLLGDAEYRSATVSGKISGQDLRRVEEAFPESTIFRQP